MLPALLLAAAVRTLDDPACAHPMVVGVGGVTLPSLAGPQVPPAFPEDARISGAAGLVLMTAVICRDGWVHDVKVLRGVPWARMLEVEAERAVRQWRYHPATKEGEPVACFMTLAVDFSINGAHGPPWVDAEVDLQVEGRLDDALKLLEKQGLEIRYRGGVPPVHLRYEQTRVQRILHALAEQYALHMELRDGTQLRVTALAAHDDEGVVAPVLASGAPAEAPPDAHGNVGLNVVVRADGTVGNVVVIRPSNSEIDRAAVEAVKRWRYQPARFRGKPIAVYLPVTVEW
jgi:TonB family protein